jgi:hypothetical protein
MPFLNAGYAVTHFYQTKLLINNSVLLSLFLRQLANTLCGTPIIRFLRKTLHLVMLG